MLSRGRERFVSQSTLVNCIYTTCFFFFIIIIGIENSHYSLIFPSRKFFLKIIIDLAKICLKYRYRIMTSFHRCNIIIRSMLNVKYVNALLRRLNVHPPVKLIKSTGSNGPFMLAEVAEERSLCRR